MQYLYNDGEFWHFMDPNSYEQYQADEAAMTAASKWLKEEAHCSVTLYNNAIILVTPPMFVELKVVETEPGIRGDTAGSGARPQHSRPVRSCAYLSSSTKGRRSSSTPALASTSAASKSEPRARLETHRATRDATPPG